MPTFTDWIETEAEMDISIDDFISECSTEEIEELVEALREDGYITAKDLLTDSFPDTELSQALTKIAQFRMQLTVEEEELIKKIGNRVCLYSL
jgi:hypothetical protein